MESRSSPPGHGSELRVGVVDNGCERELLQLRWLRKSRPCALCVSCCDDTRTVREVRRPKKMRRTAARVWLEALGAAASCPSPQRISSAAPLAFHRHPALSRRSCTVVAQSVRMQADCRAEEPGLTLVWATLNDRMGHPQTGPLRSQRSSSAHRLMAATAEQITALKC